MELSNTFVVCLGIGTVFVGLVCIVLLCKIMSAVCIIAEKSKKTVSSEVAPVVAAQSTANVVASEPIQNRQEIIAAVSAVVAEELGTDISAIRILSFKKI